MHVLYVSVVDGVNQGDKGEEWGGRGFLESGLPLFLVFSYFLCLPHIVPQF